MRFRQFYLLIRSSDREDLETVDDYQMEDFDLRKLWRGRKVAGGVPKSVKITWDTGRASDLLGNPFGWFIVSPKLRRLLEPFVGAKYAEFLPLKLYKGRKKVTRYSVMNLLGSVDAVTDKRRKDGPSIQQMLIAGNRIPANRHVFRLSSAPTLIVISAEVFDALRGKGSCGVAAYKLIMV